MNFKTTLLLLVAIVVVGIALIGSRLANRSSSDTPVEEKTLFDLKMADVGKVVVTPASGQKLALEKSGANWRIVEPINAPADTFAVETLVRGIVDAKSRGKSAVTTENAAAIGLDKPSYEVEAIGGGKTVKFAVGSRSVVGDNLYIRIAGDNEATLIPGDVYEQLDKSYTAYRQNKLVNVSANDIKQLEITKADGSKIALQKDGENWQVTAPQKMPAESSEVSSLTSALSYLTAVEFANEADIPSPLRPSTSPKVKIWFSTSAPTTQPATTRPAGTTVTFGGYDSVMKKNVFVAISDPPSLAKVAATSLDSFNKSALDLRERKVVEIDPAQVSNISVTTDAPATTHPTTQPASKSTLVLERKKENLAMGPDVPTTKPTTEPATPPAEALPPTKWAMKSAKGADASQSRVDTLLQQLHPLKADKYLGEMPKLSEPGTVYTVQISVVAAGAAKTEKHRIRLIDRGADKPLLGEYNHLVFELPHSLVDNLTGDFTNKAEPPAPPAMPPMQGMPGMPPM